MLTKRKSLTVSCKWNSERRYEQRQWNNWLYRIETEIRLISQISQRRVAEDNGLSGHCFSDTPGRTWFVTLTYRDSSLAERHSLSFYNPSPTTGHSLESLCRRDVSRYLDLCRKYFPFRYIATVEYGKQDGRIHHHLLIHCSSDVKLRSFPLWRHGFMKLKLVDDPIAAASYVSKYLVKQRGRIKCTSQYGMTVVRYANSRPKSATLKILQATKFQKLIWRFSKTLKYPTMSLMTRCSSSCSALSSPYENIFPITSYQLTREPTVQTTISPDDCTTHG